MRGREHKAYAVVEDTPATWEEYQRVVAELGAAVPAGLILHAAGRTEEGFRVIEVWRSQAEFERFQTQHARPPERRSDDLSPDGRRVRKLEVDHLLAIPEDEGRP